MVVGIGDPVRLEQRRVGSHHRFPLALRHFGLANQIGLLDRDRKAIAALGLGLRFAGGAIGIVPDHARIGRRSAPATTATAVFAIRMKHAHLHRARLDADELHADAVGRW